MNIAQGDKRFEPEFECSLGSVCVVYRDSRAADNSQIHIGIEKSPDVENLSSPPSPEDWTDELDFISSILVPLCRSNQPAEEEEEEEEEVCGRTAFCDAGKEAAESEDTIKQSPPSSQKQRFIPQLRSLRSELSVTETSAGNLEEPRIEPPLLGGGRPALRP
ncbi:unnamed protein product [Pleuronectes platessa]|uniref:Uncharacterized protein n=1 Tax=Pleuronectes platessa TaxID=8262 RepID=A0A9N7V7F3_PLEPL|nr:unnamed protein product [Pleuronectes platessa]